MPDPANDACPYPGLRAYFTRERDWYFGREEHVDAMLSRLEESRFLAIVGSSGSGKSSLVFAGLIPALIEGQLAGSRRDGNGSPAPWSIICFNPGNDPLAELAAAIVKATPKKDDPHLAGYVRAALESGGGLIEALKVADVINPERETLIYADQFEELFRFGEKASRAAQENALRFARLFVDAAEQTEVRLHMLLSMRSEFIGQCEAFPGLPEIVSRSQFLAPRLSRKQLERSLSCPAAAVGWKVAADALTAVLNDCGNSPDQLPLAQHILRRMWKRAALAQRRELTLDDYNTEGGVQKSIAEHGKDILNKLPQPAGTEVTRILFMALCEQREDGPLVRRLSTRAEIEAIAGANSALVPDVIAAFASDDPGFIQEDDGWLDVRHEAVLRQWPLISEWRSLEGESESWLHELSQAARDYEKESDKMELWRGNDLREAELWFAREKPSEAWAIRHSVKNWEACVRFLEISRQTALDLEEQKKKEAIKLREAKERRQKFWLAATGAIAMALFIIGLVMTNLWKSAKRSEIRSTEVISAFARTADELAPPIIANAKSALAEAEQQTEKLTKTLSEAGVASPPDRAAIADFRRTRDVGDRAAEAMEMLSNSMRATAKLTNDKRLEKTAQDLDSDATEIQNRRKALQRSPAALKAIKSAVEKRLSEAEHDLAGLDAKKLDTELVKARREKEIPAATANLSALDAIGEAALALGFDPEKDLAEFGPRFTALFNTLEAIQESSSGAAAPVATLKPDAALALTHTGKVNCVRFIAGPDGTPLLVSAGQDRNVWLWTSDGKQVAKVATLSAINDLAFSAQAMAIAAASDGTSVRILRWTDPSKLGTFKVDAFQGHSDSVTDVKFSHRGGRVVSGSDDRTVRVFDPTTLGQLYFTSPPLPGIVTSVVFHRGDNLVVSGCDDGGVRLHTIDRPAVQLLGEKMGAPARSPEFSFDGKLVIAASGDKTARVWTINPPREIVNLPHPAPLTQATFRPLKESEGYTFVTCATNGEVRVARMTNDITTNSVPVATVLEPRHTGAVLSATWSEDGRWLATVGGGEVLVWDWVSDFPVARVRLSGLHKDTSRAEFSADANLLATYGGDNTAHIWDLTKIPKQRER